MIDAELKVLYKAEIDSFTSGDASWWKETCDDMRRCMAARTLDQAVEILRRADWGDPVACALKLRRVRQERCPTCGGLGVIENQG